MKTLVIYYSHDGSTKLMAEVIAKELHADIEEIHPEKPINASGIRIVHWGLRQLAMHPQPKIKPLSKNPADYDRIIIGTPVWSYTFAPPIKTLVKEYKISGKLIALFCCHGGQKAKTIENLKKALPENQFIGEADFLEPIKYETQKNKCKVQKWVATL